MTDAPDAVTKVARDLSEMTDLAAHLAEQARHKANDHELPGGAAMVALAPVADPEAWEHRFETAERLWAQRVEQGKATDKDRPEAYEDEDSEPPLQTLLFWSEQWRVEHNAESDLRPTLDSEARFIRQVLNWAWENEPHFEDFADDVHAARVRLEAILHAGERAERGAPCLRPSCKGARLERWVDDKGNRSDWQCPECRREWDDDAYSRMVTAAHVAANFEVIDGETWASEHYAASEVGRSVKTIRAWVEAGAVAVACIVTGRRPRFVNLREVREQDETRQRRRRKVA